MPLPDDDMEVPGASGSSAANALVPNKSPSDKRSKKSDDEESDVDAEVREAAKGLEGGESEDFLQGSRRQQRSALPRSRIRQSSLRS